MNFFQRAFSKEAPRTDEKYERAMRLSEEVRDTLRKTAEDPFTAIALDIARGVLEDGADPALIADVYEQIQEANIFHSDKPAAPKDTR
jgi:hypothetical protein